MKVNKKLKLAILITNRDLGIKLTNFLRTKGIENYFSFYGKGSASTALLEYLGIGETEKDIIIYPSNEEDANSIMENVKNSEYFKNTIAFIVPVKGISNMNALNHFLKEVKDHE